VRIQQDQSRRPAGRELLRDLDSDIRSLLEDQKTTQTIPCSNGCG
jgi:hypothetical protein